VDISTPAFSIHVDSDCGDDVTRWYLRYPDGHFHHVGRTADKFEAVHKALIRAEKDCVTVDRVTFTDESVAKYFHAQLDTIAKPVATGDVLCISAVTKLDTVLPDVPTEIENDNDDDSPPTGGSSPAPAPVKVDDAPITPIRITVDPVHKWTHLAGYVRDIHETLKGMPESKNGHTCTYQVLARVDGAVAPLAVTITPDGKYRVVEDLEMDFTETELHTIGAAMSRWVDDMVFNSSPRPTGNCLFCGEASTEWYEHPDERWSDTQICMTCWNTYVVHHIVMNNDAQLLMDFGKDDPPPTGGSSPTPSDTEKKVILGAFMKADSYKGRHFSIALSQPKGCNYQQLTFLAPTPEMLKEWKAKKDVVTYTHRYNAHLTANKAQVLEWMKGLQGDEVLLCWEPYVAANSDRERQFCHRLILGRLIAKHRPDLTVYVSDLRCPGCGNIYEDISKAGLSRTGNGYAFVCGNCPDKVVNNSQPTIPSQRTGLMNVRIYTDGGSRNGKGGYGVVLVSGEHRKEMSTLLGEGVTNQAAELHAAIAGLKALKSPEKCNVTLVTDSKYVIGWATGEYTKLSGSKNKDLIHTLFDYRDVCGKFKTQWVKGHTGDAKQKGQALSANERCDELATQAITSNA